MYKKLLVILLSIINKNNKNNIKCVILKKNLCQQNKDEICAAAAIVGDLSLLIYAHKNGCTFDACDGYSIAFNRRTVIKRDSLMDYAIIGDNLDCIKYVQENGGNLKFNNETVMSAARGGHLSLLKYLRENGCSWDHNTTFDAMQSKHFECAKYAYMNAHEFSVSNDSHYDRRDYDNNICRFIQIMCYAARIGNLELLKYFHENRRREHKCIWIEHYSREYPCSTNKHSELGGADQNEDCDIPWNREIIVEALKEGNIECIKYVHENGCPWPENTILLALEKGYFDFIKYAHENGCPWPIETIPNAAKKGNIELIKYAHENGCPWGEGTTAIIATIGNLEFIKYLHENGCPWDDKTISNAIVEGHIDLVKYAHENGCPWGKGTTTTGLTNYAAKTGNLEFLKYAHENGCPWDKGTTYHAAEAGHIECLKYACENRCPLHPETMHIAVKNKHLECYQYINEIYLKMFSTIP